jgi:hypothetical protein
MKNYKTNKFFLFMTIYLIIIIGIPLIYNMKGLEGFIGSFSILPLIIYIIGEAICNIYKEDR